jgi:YebC/PmpR family DNA-binding regulatory protein
MGHMSGHSKWHNIQAKKGKADKAKSGQFTKVSRLITVAAKQGGGDANMNFSLRLAIEKAKEVNMPKDNIERAIKKGTGGASGEAQFEEVLYEGFGPGGAAILIEALTDNRNRTNSEVRAIASKNGGNIGASGSVQWQFQHLGVIRIAKEELAKVTSRDDFDFALIDVGAEDIEESEFGVEIYCQIQNFQKVMEKVQSFGITPTDSGFEWISKETISLDAEASASLEKLIELLEDFDDVRSVFTNAQ